MEWKREATDPMLVSRSSGQCRGQWSLVGLMVAATVLIILAALYIPRIAKRHSQPGEVATPTERGYGAACSEYVSQMNQAVQIYKTDHDDKAPARVEDLKSYGVTDDMIHAPGCSFQVDPATGTVFDTGGGRARPGAVSAPPGAPSAPAGSPPAPNGGSRGPGGVTIPNIPGAGSGL